MRDYSRFRNRLLAAMGLVGAVPAAVACSTPPAAGDAATTAADAADTSAAVDSAGPADTGALDAGAETAPTADSAAPKDGGPGETAAADTAGPDLTAPDAGTADAATADAAPDTATLPDTQSGDVAMTDAISDTQPPVCNFGKPTQECFTAKALKANIESPPMGGEGTPDAYTGVLPPEGCPDPKLVKDGCCNPAATPGVVVGDTCCYYFCTGACCGRPLVVDGVARVAALVARSEWSTGAHGYCPTAAANCANPFDDLSVADRDQLATAWRADAADEHASIASFLRFGLDLLAFGAPPDLVADAANAATDEVRHAKQCCAIAHSLDGLETGPGALRCGDLGAHTDLAAAASAAVVEGCVGETLAAICLGTAARRVGAGAVRETLQAMADDEARHAELAWRFVRWAWAQPAQPGVRAAIAQAFERVQDSAPTRDPRTAALQGVANSARLVAGRLPARDYAAACQGAMAQIVLPCARALMAGEPCAVQQGVALAA